MILRKKVNAVTHGVTYGVTNLTNKTINKHKRDTCTS